MSRSRLPVVVALCALWCARTLHVPRDDADRQQQQEREQEQHEHHYTPTSPLPPYQHQYELLEPDENDTSAKNKTPLFPTDLFTVEQRREGALVLHVFGVVYMFVALAIVCDEFFVPALDVIIEKLEITDDVAGATFMAAGGSAPELFTSVIGVFVSFDDVGIGTIVGSAVFNILFVIGMCALFSRTVLTLTWWPLFRDCSFYSASLMALIYFFRDSTIQWWEALILFMFYLSYVSFMKWNQEVERFVKKIIYKNKVTRVRSTDQLMPTHQAAAQTLHGNVATSSETSVGTGPGGSVTSRAASDTTASAPHSASSGSHTGAKFRHGLLQLMIHTIDPLHDGKVDEKATQLHAIASLKVLLDATKPQNGAATSSAANHVTLARETTLAPGAQEMPNGVANALADVNLDAPYHLQRWRRIANIFIEMVDLSAALLPAPSHMVYDASTSSTAPYHLQRWRRIANIFIEMVDLSAALLPAPSHMVYDASTSSTARRMSTVRARKSLTTQAVVCLQVAGAGAGASGAGDSGDEEPPEALDMSWPDTCRKRITYVLLAPIVFPLWLTLPDTRTPRGKKFFAVTFIGSIVWIAAYSYLMVWWATVIGDTLQIPPEVMGLTALAAGTSIPDLITSVIVARKGFGDMAVSSSVGSNIFDVTVGLPVPWLLYAIIYREPVTVNSTGMVCSISILFMMLLFVILSIACFRWKMNKGLGFTMFLLYFVFVAVSLMFEYDVMTCPV